MNQFLKGATHIGFKRILLGVLIGALPSNSFAQSDEKIVLVSHGGIGNPFWTVVFNGAKQAAAEQKVKLQILFPNQDGSQSGTTQKLSEAISTNPKGIAVTLATPSHCDYIQEARKKGISVVIFNAQALNASSKCPYQAYIGMNETEAGRISARRALESGRITKRVMVGLTEAGHAGLQARAKGITEVLKSKSIQVDILDLGNDPTQIPSRLKSYYLKSKNEVSAFFIPSPNGLHPLIHLMSEDPQGIGKLYVAGFDLTPLILKAISENKMDHTIDQQPFLQGYYAVTQLILAIRNQFTPLDMNTGVGLVTKENASQIEALVKKGIR